MNRRDEACSRLRMTRLALRLFLAGHGTVCQSDLEDQLSASSDIFSSDIGHYIETCLPEAEIVLRLGFVALPSVIPMTNVGNPKAAAESLHAAVTKHL